MLSAKQTETGYRVDYRSYRLALALLLLPPLVAVEFVPGLLGGELDSSEVAALILGVGLPLAGALYLFEIASFYFSWEDDCFHWRWRNLLRRETLDLPLSRIVGVRRETVETGDSEGDRLSYRLVVVLDDDSTVGLTRGYSNFQARKLKQVVDEIREYLGYVVPLR